MKLSAVLLIILGSCIAQAQQPETVLYNMATSGLYLRSQPKTSARVITKVPYATQVTVLERTDVSSRVGWIEDNWLKVHFRGRTGYLFAGYLSPIPTPKKEETSGNLSNLLTNYSSSAFTPSENAVETIEEDLVHCFQAYGPTAFLETEEQKGHLSASLTFSSNDIFDAFILLEALLFWNSSLDTLDQLRFVKGKDGQIIRISDAEGNIRITMTSEDQVTLLLNGY
jgi:hypothetical protein